MDLHQELHRLKQQVSDMSLRFPQTSSVQPRNTFAVPMTTPHSNGVYVDSTTLQQLNQLSGLLTQLQQLDLHRQIMPLAQVDAPVQQYPAALDRFSEQMDDLKAHLARIENTMATNWNSSHHLGPYTSPSQTFSLSAQSPVHPTAYMPDHTTTEKPAGVPACGYSLKSVRGDVQRLERHLMDLQDSFEELEDRLEDALYPVNKFTPPASINSEQCCSHEGRMQAGPPGQGQLYVEPHQALSDLSPSHVGSHVRGTESYRYPSCTLSAFQNAGDAIAELQGRATGPWSTSLADCGHCMPASTLPKTNEQKLRTQGGVAYRDQEITRLDELLRTAQESLIAKEEDVNRLIADMEAADEALSNKTAAMGQLQSDLKTKEEALEQLFARTRQHAASQVEILREYEAMEARAQRAEQLLQECRNSRDEQIDMIVSNRDEQVRQLQDFCEQKDAVAYEQGQIVARGARLMGQKDEEIEALSRRLRAAEDEAIHEGRQRTRLARLLGERDDEIAAYKDTEAEIKRVCELPLLTKREQPERQWGELVAKLHCIGRVVGASEQQEQPRDVDAVQSGFRRILVRGPRGSQPAEEPSSFGANVAASPPWTPQAIEGDKRLPHEARRASMWEEEARQQERPKFGHPSPIGYRSGRGKVTKTDSRSHRYVSREGHARSGSRGRGDTNRHEPRGSRNDHQDEWERHENTNTLQISANEQTCGTHGDAQRAPSSERHRLHATSLWWPPLPAPTQPASAHEARSTADLRAVPQYERQGSLAKHRSMQELPRRQFQAYVETEAESGGDGELGGEV